MNHAYVSVRLLPIPQALLTQSDRMWVMKETLPKPEYQVSACEYVSYVFQTAIVIVQELEEVAGQQEQLVM